MVFVAQDQQIDGQQCCKLGNGEKEGCVACNCDGNSTLHNDDDDDLTLPQDSPFIDLPLQDKGKTASQVQDLAWRNYKYATMHIVLNDGNDEEHIAINPMKHCKFMHGTINEEEPFVQLREMVKMPLKSNQAMVAEDGIINSNIAQICEMTLETLFTKKCHRGEAIRLELPHGSPGGLEPTFETN